MEELIVDVSFRGVDGKHVTHSIPVVRTTTKFKPYRSQALFEDHDCYNVDLTKYCSPSLASVFKFIPRRTRTPRVYLEFFDNPQPSQPPPLVPSIVDSAETVESPRVLASEPSCVDNETKKRKKKKTTEIKNKKVTVIDGPEPAPEMLARLRELIEEENGSGVVLVLQKMLYESDTATQQNRFSMPMNQIASLEFLDEEELKRASSRNESNKKKIAGLEVTLIEPDLDTRTTVNFKRWDLKHTQSFMFTHGWSKIVARNNLKPKQIVQVWFFRDSDRKPCFAMVRL